MSGRHQRRRGDPGSPVVDLADVFADDDLIEALLGGRPVAAGSGAPAPWTGRAGGADVLGSDPLIDLFETWRDELVAAPLPARPAVSRAADAVADGHVRRNRSVRPALFIVAAIIALLIGSAAVGSRTAKPGDTLWGLASVLWSDRTESVNSVKQVNLAMDRARRLLADGRQADARTALIQATVELGQIDALDMPESMRADVQTMWRQLVPATTPSVGGQQQSLEAVSPPATTSSDRQALASSIPGVAATYSGPVQARTADPTSAAVPPLLPAGGPVNPDPAWPSPLAAAGSATPPTASVGNTAPTPAADPSTPSLPAATSEPQVPAVPATPTESAPVTSTDTPSVTEQSPPTPSPTPESTLSDSRTSEPSTTTTSGTDSQTPGLAP
jgi:hypothetical protein